MARELTPRAGSALLFLPEAETEELRAAANIGMERCGGVCAVFTGADGDWRFVMAGRTVDMRAFIKENAPALRARGGGQERMISGTSRASRAELEAFFEQ